MGDARRRSVALTVALAVVLPVLGSCTNNDSHPPAYALSSVHPSVTGVSLITRQGPHADNVAKALQQLGAVEPIGPISVSKTRSQQYVVGRFTMIAGSATPGSTYVLFIVDNRSHHVLSQIWPAPSEGNTLSKGWDYGMNAIAKKFPAFASVADTAQPDGSYTNDAQGVTWSAGPAEGFAFYGILPADAAPINQPKDISIGLALIGPSHQPLAAGRLY